MTTRHFKKDDETLQKSFRICLDGENAISAKLGHLICVRAFEWSELENIHALQRTWLEPQILRGDRWPPIRAEIGPRTRGQARVNFFDLARPTIAKDVDGILMRGQSPLELIFQHLRFTDY